MLTECLTSCIWECLISQASSCPWVKGHSARLTIAMVTSRRTAGKRSHSFGFCPLKSSIDPTRETGSESLRAQMTSRLWSLWWILGQEVSILVSRGSKDGISLAFSGPNPRPDPPGTVYCLLPSTHPLHYSMRPPIMGEGGASDETFKQP